MVPEIAAHVVGEEHQIHRGGLRALPDVDVAPDVVAALRRTGMAPARHVVAVADRKDPEIHLARPGRAHEAESN